MIYFALLCGLLWIYARFIEPEWLQIKRLEVTLPRLPPEFDAYTLVQISDLHLEAWLGRARLEKIIQRVNALQPDMVVITGDFVSHRWDGQIAEDLRSTLSQLAPRDGSLAIFGNHDHKVNTHYIDEVLAACGIQNISNDVYWLERGKAQLFIAGVDSVSRQKYRLEKVLEKTPPQGIPILLVHEPDFADKTATTGLFDLQLSGHTHGGQIKIPFWGALKLPRNGKKYPDGLYRIHDMLLYTNRGVGMGSWPYRFYCRPEITVFTLKSPSVS